MLFIVFTYLCDNMYFTMENTIQRKHKIKMKLGRRYAFNEQTVFGIRIIAFYSLERFTPQNLTSVSSIGAGVNIEIL